jgi:uncharacterized protein YrrD
MLRSMNDLENYAIGATDGPIGQVKDFYFDDDAWVIRYFVVEAGTWLSSRKVLISPMSVTRPDWLERLLPVAISKEQVKNSPDIDTDKPVSRQQEAQTLGYYGYSMYWEGPSMWGEGLYPYPVTPVGRDTSAERIRDAEAYIRNERERHRNDDPHLRSCKAVVGHTVRAIDGEIGHVDDLLVDEETWAVRYMVVQTGHWWRGHKVLVAPQWISGVHWSDSSVTVDLTQASVQGAPPFESSDELNRQRESGLYAHYGRGGYWGSSDSAPRP